MKLICFKLFLLFVLLNSYPGYTQLDNTNPKIIHGPWLQNPGENGITVMWVTNKECVPWLKYGQDKDSFISVQNSHYGLFDASQTLHKIRITGLEPGTKYQYQIFSKEILKFKPYKVYYGDTVRSRRFSFTTLDSNKSDVYFSVISDMHEKSAKLDTLLNQIDIEKTELIFLNGDMINYLEEEDQLFSGFIDTCVNSFAKDIPFIYNRGNHETRGYKARELFKYFDTPNKETYFSFNHGPVHFIMMDGGEDKPDSSQYYYGLADFDNYRDQGTEWLKNDIKSRAFKTAKYKIAIIHIPMLDSENPRHGQQYIRDNWGPVFEKANIDIMLCGHKHRFSWNTEEETGINCPILVAGNNERIEVEVNQEKIKATVIDKTGVILGSYEVK